jgi:hypothetical protein
VACVLALAALRVASGPDRGKSAIIRAPDPIEEIDREPW